MAVLAYFALRTHRANSSEIRCPRSTSNARVLWWQSHLMWSTRQRCRTISPDPAVLTGTGASTLVPCVALAMTGAGST